MWRPWPWRRRCWPGTRRRAAGCAREEACPDTAALVWEGWREGASRAAETVRDWILRAVTWVMVPAGILLVVSQLFRSGEPLYDALRGSVAGVGAMVPEGLVLSLDRLRAGAMRLARRRVLVQELAAIEGLARVDVLCIDKTGTLTKPGPPRPDHVAGQEPWLVRHAAAALLAVSSARRHLGPRTRVACGDPAWAGPGGRRSPPGRSRAPPGRRPASPRQARDGWRR